MPIKVKVKDHDKCKEWERRRRDRLNDAFKNLAQLLPHYDPANIPVKIEILEKSTEFVKELRLSNSRLLSKQAETDEKCKLIKELQDEVNKLILRVKQLTILLKKADITIPTGPEIKSLGSRRLKWSRKLKPEDVENSVIRDGSTVPSEKIPASSEKEKESVNSLPPDETESTVSNLSSQSVNEIKTNSTAINSNVASIIVPLKETNVSTPNIGDKPSVKTHASQDPPISTTTTSAVVTSTSCQASSITTLVTSILPSSIQTSPTKVFTTSDPIFSTATISPLQLPLQTFIITPCPITGSAQATALPTQNPQIVTRIANILPAPVLPKALDSISLQKIPIKSLLKPIPKVIKRRNRKSKKAVVLPKPIVKPTDNAVSTDKNLVERIEDYKKSKKVTESEEPAKTINKNEEPATPTEIVSSEEQKEKSDENESDEGALPSTNDSVTESNNIIEAEITETRLPIKSLPAVVQDVVKICEPLNETVAPVEVNSPEKASSGLKKRTLKNPEVEESSENIPVLRIVEAHLSEQKEVSTRDVLSTVVVQISKEKETESSKNAEKDKDLVAMVSTTVENVQPLETMQVDEANVSNVPSSQERIALLVSTFDALKEKLDKENDLLESTSPNINENDGTNKMDVVVQSDVLEQPAEQVSGCATSSMSSSVLTNAEKSKEPAVEEVPTLGMTKAVVEVPTLGMAKAVVEVPTLEMAKAVVNVPTVEMAKGVASASNKQLDCSTDKTKNAIRTTTPDAPTPTVLTTSSEQLKENNPAVKPVEVSQDLPQPLAPSEILSSSEPVIPVIALNKEKKQDNEATTAPKNIMEITESVTTTDKISECIARSIDLIDANDSELMELGEHWEDTGTSPKSISPTQIFLNIFPLLPRESAVTDSQLQPQSSSLQQQPHQHPSTSTSQASNKNHLSFLPSTSSRSSFFIDAMLPDDNSGHGSGSAVVNASTDMNISSSHSPYLPLTPPQYSSSNINQLSSPFSLSNSYYWTPPPVAASNNTPTTTSSFTSFSNQGYSHFEGQHTKSSVSTSSTNNVVTTTSTITPISTTKTSSVSVSSNAHKNDNNKSTGSKSGNFDNQRSSKRSKTTASSSNVGKLAVTVGTSLMTSSSSKVKPTAASSSVSKTITPTTINVSNVTWTSTTTNASSTSSSQHHHLSTVASANSTLETNLHSSSAPSTSQIAHHSCSLLDSLNPMDAAFFRPLMNALDSHDFRNLDFTGSNSFNTLQPPQPLLPLIPPPPNKPLYSSQFSTNTQNVHSSVSTTNYHDHTTITPAPLQTSFVHHHHQPAQIFGNIPQVAPESIMQTHSGSASVNEKPQASTQLPHHSTNVISHHPVQQAITVKPLIPPLVENATKVSLVADKTSRTSGRQKTESARKSKSGKSSRTQPYVVPTSQTSTDMVTTSSKPVQRQDRVTTVQKPSVSYSVHTIQSHINPSPAKSTSVPRSHDFQMENFHLPHFEAPETRKVQKYDERAGSHPSQVDGIHLPKHSDPKKSKGDKSQAYSSASISKQSKSPKSNFFSQHPQSSSQPPLHDHQASSSSRNVSSQKLGSANNAHLTSHATSTVAQQQEPVKKLHTIHHSSGTDTAAQVQPFQAPHSSAEPFQLFPEFNVTGNSRPHTHYYHENAGQVSLQQQSQDQSTSSNNFQVHRSHPYYFSDIASSFENFTGAPIHPPQHPTSHQATNKQTDSSGTGPQSAMQGTDSRGKFSYGTINPNISQGQQAPSLQVNQQAPSLQVSQQAPSLQVSQQAPSLQVNQQDFQQTHANQHHKSAYPHQDSLHVHSCNQQASLSQVQQGGSQSQQRQHSHPTQLFHQAQSRGHHSQTSTSTTSTTATASLSNSKGKQPQMVPSFSFNAPSTHHHHPQANSNQHLQQVHHQATHHQQQQNVPQPQHHPTSRSSSSKTVNWMTDTGYRSTSSQSTPSTSVKQQRQSSTVSTNNPFSVSKLVGSSASGPSKPQQANVSSNVPASNVRPPPPPQQLQSSSQSGTNSANPATRNTNKSTRNPVATTSTIQSQNQSNYCAEALIRKNPPASNEWTNDFTGTGSGYSITNLNSNLHTHHHHHNHHQHHTTTGPEHFPSYPNMSASGSYHYPATSQISSSNASQFTHYDHQQPQYQTAQHHVQPMSSSNYNPSSTTSVGHRQHGAQSHSTQNQSGGGNQLHYPHQQHYPHQSSHHQHTHGSTSSVTNFNLSTIFPEINDKRNNSELGGHRQSATGGNSIDNGRGSGNMNASCNYHHHLNFENQPGGSGNNNMH